MRLEFDYLLIKFVEGRCSIQDLLKMRSNLIRLINLLCLLWSYLVCHSVLYFNNIVNPYKTDVFICMPIFIWECWIYVYLIKFTHFNVIFTTLLSFIRLSTSIVWYFLCAQKFYRYFWHLFDIWFPWVLTSTIIFVSSKETIKFVLQQY